jgi:hypothetical protein
MGELVDLPHLRQDPQPGRAQHRRQQGRDPAGVEQRPHRRRGTLAGGEPPGVDLAFQGGELGRRQQRPAHLQQLIGWVRFRLVAEDHAAVVVGDGEGAGTAGHAIPPGREVEGVPGSGQNDRPYPATGRPSIPQSTYGVLRAVPVAFAA